LISSVREKASKQHRREWKEEEQEGEEEEKGTK
jgi:hypothetical protein